VTQTANQIKASWLDRIRGGLPDVAADLSGFMQVAQGVRRGDGSRSLSDLIVAADTLAERAETAYKWITSPLQSLSDQVTADAIDMVRADSAYKRSDPRLHTIFRGIKTINEIAHETNPFTKAISGAAFDQIDQHFEQILGELEHLEAEVGSFNYSRRKHADQPIANPFKGTPPKRAASMPDSENPFRSPSVVQPQGHTSSPELVTSTNTNSTNPFRAGGSGSDVMLIPPKPKPAQTAKQPTATTSADPMVQYRDPATGQLSTKRRSALPPSVSGDDPEGTRCSKDGVGIVTEPCETRRRAGESGAVKSVR
jgi:hypothetical protein